jgi:uncharacterized membrane protein YjjB (DUF3815 family)
MTSLEVTITVIASFGATIGSAIVFNTSKYDILRAAFVGACGWLVYTLLKETAASLAVAYFAGAFVVALISEIFAFVLKNPATVYLLPGLFPLVPGGGMFQTMEAAVGGNMEKALSTGFSTLTAAGAIAIGIAVVSSLAKIVHRLRKDYKNPRRKLEN